MHNFEMAAPSIPTMLSIWPQKSLPGPCKKKENNILHLYLIDSAKVDVFLYFLLRQLSQLLEEG